jgi:hypothetical protein
VQIGVINNLRAGRSGRKVSKILELLRAYPNVVHVETDRAAALSEAIGELSRREIDLLVVNGGDGSLQHTLTEILVHRPFPKVPLVAPLRGGRTNMTALDLGAHRDPIKGLWSLLEAATRGEVSSRIVQRPVLRVEVAKGGGVHYGMFFGAGMIHRAIALTHQLFPTGAAQGSLGAGLVTMGLVGKTALRPRDGVLQPDKVLALLDGDLVEGGEFYLTIATSLRRLFWRLDPFWGAGDAPVRFTCISNRAPGFLRSAPGILWGRPGALARTADGYTSRNVDRAVLRFDCGFTVDGETFSEQPDEVVTLSGDHRIRFVRA